MCYKDDVQFVLKQILISKVFPTLTCVLTFKYTFSLLSTVICIAVSDDRLNDRARYVDINHYSIVHHRCLRTQCCIPLVSIR